MKHKIYSSMLLSLFFFGKQKNLLLLYIFIFIYMNRIAGTTCTVRKGEILCLSLFVCV